MGQTLTNGIFLPNEGERNCYTGLESNWRAIDGYIGAYNVHVANVVIHVSQADRDKWDAVDNKADSSALTAHTGDTTIHVTAEDKNKWDAVTTKANDADVMHKSGDETAAGIKTFSDATYVKSLNFTYNVPDPSSSSYSQFFITNTITYTSGDPSVTARVNFRVLANGTISIFPHENNLYSLGLQGRRFKDFYTYLVNSNNPGALSMPNLSAGVDISGYLTNAGTTTPSEYTPTVDGWLVLAISADSPAFIRVFSSGGIDATAYSERNEIGSTSGGTYTRYAALTVPCRQNDKQNIIIMPSTMGIVKAMFYPCTGNV